MSSILPGTLVGAQSFLFLVHLSTNIVYCRQIQFVKHQIHKAAKLGHKYAKSRLFPLPQVNFKLKVSSLEVHLKQTIYIQFSATLLVHKKQGIRLCVPVSPPSGFAKEG